MYCSKCGEKNINSAKFCVNCGASIEDISEKPRTKDNIASAGIDVNKTNGPDPKKIKKWKTSVKNAGTSANIFGWLQLIAGTALFVWYLLDNNFSDSGLADKFDASGYVTMVYSAIIFIVLGNRIKLLKDVHTSRYLNFLLLLSVVMLIVTVFYGGSLGIIFLLVFVGLISGANSIGKLNKLESFRSELAPSKHKIKTLFWVSITVIAIIAFFLAAIYGPNRSQATTNTSNDSGVVTNTISVNWITFSPERGGFTALLPSSPESSSDSQQIPDSDTTVTIDSYSVDNEFFINVFHYTGSVDFSNPEINLQNVLDGMLTSFTDSVLLSSQATTKGNNQALEFKMKVDTEILQGVLITKNQTIYQVFTDYFEGQDDPTAHAKFINGFTLN
ncbi:MAG: zinc ribbon domain-containing protein [Candidatus Gottesmanbacteria bacterium]